MEIKSKGIEEEVEVGDGGGAEEGGGDGGCCVCWCCGRSVVGCHGIFSFLWVWEGLFCCWYLCVCVCGWVGGCMICEVCVDGRSFYLE